MPRSRQHQTAPRGEDDKMPENVSTIWSLILKALDRIQPAHKVFLLLALVFISWIYFSKLNIDATVVAAMVLFLVFSFGCFAFFLEHKDRELAKLKEMNAMLERQLRYAGKDYVRLRYLRTAKTEAVQGNDPVSEPPPPQTPGRH